MPTLRDELLEIGAELESYVALATSTTVEEMLENLEQRAQKVGRAWSGSWIGYHANVYFKDLEKPPPGRHFDSEWGFINVRSSSTDRTWIEYDPDEVRSQIEDSVNQSEMEHAVAFARKGRQLFDDKRDQVISILETSKTERSDSFIDELLTKTKELKIASVREIIAHSRPDQFMTRDSLASSQGFWTPPHISVLAEIISIRAPAITSNHLASICGKAASHLARIASSGSRQERIGNRVFIGHGQSSLWRELKDFVEDRLRLKWDEFNRIPVAGRTNIERLSEMLDSASIAFLVMTAEDEQPDGSIRARMNVIHEAGLFQGRLGFDRAVVLLEEGCDEFSNIHGLVQIRFPNGKIAAAFEEIRKVLEREGILQN